MQRPSRNIGRARTGKTILYMLLMGIVCVFVAAHLYSFAVRIGLSPLTAARLPSYGFFVGLVLGLAISVVQSVKNIFAGLLVMVVLGGTFWFIGVVLEALLVAFGLDPDTASWISRIAFWLGMVLGSLTLYAFVRDIVDSLYQRLKSAR
ncbi:MAG TPA: hypothetical protein VKB88_15720 [Bryobacteraceae bacterium]|nr:hypothetical protein [Bryobacteraceae bacterium]